MIPSYRDVVQATPSDNKTLKEIMQIHPWKGGQPADTHRAILRGLIKRVAQLEEAGISCGVLDATQITYQGSKVTIRNEPTRNEPSQERFREQIKIWVSKSFQVPAALHGNIESQRRDFLVEIGKEGDNFKQLESHPFLLSYEEKANFLMENITKLNNEHDGWRMKYKVTNVVKFPDLISRYEKGFSEVFLFHKRKYGRDYEENALGALWYSRNAVAHVPDDFGPNEKPPSIEEVGKRLSEFFPEMMLGFYKFVVKEGIDLRSEPGIINLED
ncbi:hypothetical protein C1H46_032907 [Malus baccata]|uniref:KEN domain-containing protein n=1 Tax=Malus baccata TaxID=106549 RepID=A0A540L518_MALBA|nr:hypothetical protein C1H46_032907 [Malus baccata]